MSLLRQRNQAVSKARSLQEAAFLLETSIRDAVYQFKQISRAAGSNVALREILQLDPDFEVNASRLSDYSVFDWTYARRYARNFAAIWLSKALEKRDSYLQAVRRANSGSLHRIELIAATESSKAFNEGRTLVSEQVEFEAYKRWDSTMDTRTCPTCADTDGEIVSIVEQFSIGEPGSVHPNCRCTYSIISDSEASAYINVA